MTDSLLNALGWLLLGAGMLAGMLLAVLQLPGTWLILGIAGAYAWLYHFQRVGWAALACMAVLAIAGELVELLAGVHGARKAGATPAAGWGALVGGLIGMVVFTPLIPIPIAGTVMGGLLGCFGGAFLMEHRQHGRYGRSARIGVSAAQGRLVGLLAKLVIAITMAGIALGAAIQ